MFFQFKMNPNGDRGTGKQPDDADDQADPPVSEADSGFGVAEGRADDR